MSDIQRLALLYFFLIALGVASYISSKILIRKINRKIDELFYQINSLNSRMHILEKKVDRIENVRLLTEDKIRKKIENFCKEIGDHEND